MDGAREARTVASTYIDLRKRHVHFFVLISYRTTPGAGIWTHELLRLRIRGTPLRPFDGTQGAEWPGPDDLQAPGQASDKCTSSAAQPVACYEAGVNSGSGSTWMDLSANGNSLLELSGSSSFDSLRSSPGHQARRGLYLWVCADGHAVARV